MNISSSQFARSVILVADDDPTIRLLVSEALGGVGYQVEEAEDGNQALAILGVMKADLILLDVTMPGKSGFEVCEALRRIPGYEQIPVLMATGHDDVESIRKAFEVGASDFLTKPINWELLPHRINFLIRAHRDEKERKRAQEEILRLNHQTQLLLNSAGEGICGLDTSGRITFMNTSASQLLGYEQGELLSEPIHKLLSQTMELSHPHDLSTIPIYLPLVDQRIHRSSEEIFFRKDHTPLMVEYVCTPTKLGDQITGAVVVFRDISAKSAMERRERAHYTITRILAECPNADEALPRIVESICHILNWDLGIIWKASQDKSFLTFLDARSPSSPQFVSFIDHCQHTSIPLGMGLAGQVWASGNPEWVEELHAAKGFLEWESFDHSELTSAFGFPIMAGKSIVAIMEFFSRTPQKIDEDLLALFQAVGSQVGHLLDRKQAVDALRESQNQLIQAQKIAQLGYWQWDLSSSTFHISEETRRLLGETFTSFTGTHEEFVQAIHPNDREDRNQTIQQALNARTSYSLEYRLVGEEGQERIISELGELILDDLGRPIQITGVIQDITERKYKEYQIHTLAHYDTLTNLPNRLMFHTLLEQSLATSQRQNQPLAILLLNIDRFTRINETLGYRTGDLLLQEIGKRLLRSIRRTDAVARHNETDSSTTISRFGGDEFTILLTSFKSVENAAKVARRVIARLAQPFHIGSQEIFITTSIGISLYPNDGNNEETLLQNAQVALQHAKDNGRNISHYFSPNMNASSSAKLTMESNLHKAIERSEFLLYYQPQIDIQERQIVGVEALIRWQHPELGIVSPGDFIPLAEESGLIKSIGEWALHTACQQHQRWQEQGLPPIRIGVNLSSLQFRDQDWVMTIDKVLKEGLLDPRYLELELTEGIVMRDVEETMNTLHYLKKLGIKLAIDDFGTGYSSLSYLKRLPLDTIKIDQAFIKDLTTNEQDASITKAIIALGHSLDLRVIAEGVETEGQFRHLEEQGCDEIQGYFFSPAVPANAIVQLFESQFAALLPHPDLILA
ncbi:EAL domain-containing protein [Candidatus Nitronereus thalassa]|uniref:EAL domain-containing protein n=1 Tax=Candidatus Nitronereus thalassa TaxID=3020898 RepID=A0ABU3K7H7_9BACT|nr:EAL domain-containing protein [Candidatus Nitronereus thalassa]MDT7042372.1 EAL domain-containing protein [Candidatus Nitronereus thalassa]